MLSYLLGNLHGEVIFKRLLDLNNWIILSAVTYFTVLYVTQAFIQSAWRRTVSRLGAAWSKRFDLEERSTLKHLKSTPNQISVMSSVDLVQGCWWYFRYSCEKLVVVDRPEVTGGQEEKISSNPSANNSLQDFYHFACTEMNTKLWGAWFSANLGYVTT